MIAYFFTSKSVNALSRDGKRKLYPEAMILSDDTLLPSKRREDIRPNIIFIANDGIAGAQNGFFRTCANVQIKSLLVG
ncbi:MAG TPA: hypothetical protein PKZ45_02585 [Dysgonamonadaceae bacterium]|nr:hypothetical protein [Dysgonamonadaceae bacterium]